MTMTLDGTAGMTAPQGAVYNGLATASAQASTSGTSIDFTNIPVWAKRITVMFNGVSTNGTSNPQIQLGSGGVETTGYNSASGQGAAASVSNYTTGFGFASSNATNILYGAATFTVITGNVWSCFFTFGSNGNVFYGGGTKSLTGVLDRVRITTVNGTDTFDAGTINIMYE